MPLPEEDWLLPGDVMNAAAARDAAVGGLVNGSLRIEPLLWRNQSGPAPSTP
jgi:hypothetical protein